MSEYDVATQEGHEQFVRDCWDFLAYHAYDGYLRLGRGAVVVTPVKSELKIKGPAYLPLDTIDGSPPDPEQFLPGFVQCLTEYDPAQEFVCMFALGGDLSFFARYASEDPAKTPAILHSVFKRGGKTQ